MKKFVAFEKKIKSIFKENIGKSILYNGETVTIQSVGKPTSPHGEPVTDIFVMLKDKYQQNIELKISVKKNDADFLVNKTSAEVAENLLGPDWKNIIITGTKKIEDKFYNCKLIFKRKKGRTEKGCFTLGWKYEIMLGKTSGNLSTEINLDVSSVLKGLHIKKDQRDALVNGELINNSGVSNTILFGNIDDYHNLDEVISSLKSIDDYVSIYNPRISFACKALNYRSLYKPQPKWDGNRPLAVQIMWKINQSGKLDADYIFDKPLLLKGNEVANNLSITLRTLGLQNTTHLNPNDIANPSWVHN